MNRKSSRFFGFLMASEILIIGLLLPATIGAKEKFPEPSSQWLGSYSNYSLVQNSKERILVDIWQDEKTVIGHFHFGTRPGKKPQRGILENIQFDRASGAISFYTKLTSSYPKIHHSPPQLVKFEGILKDDEFNGTIEHFDSLETQKPIRKEKITLVKKDLQIVQDNLRTSPNQKEWQKSKPRIFKERSPEW